ncbi:hypothetical protein AVEN_196535-1, partial [Araneus ventricosus]
KHSAAGERRKPEDNMTVSCFIVIRRFRAIPPCWDLCLKLESTENHIQVI